MNDSATLIGTDLNGYTVLKYISNGSFGTVYECKNNVTNESVAIKIPIVNDEKNGEKSLIEEGKIYKYLNKNKTDGDGILNVKILSNKTLNKKIMVMDLLGLSLEKIIHRDKKLRLKNVILITIQILYILQFIHSQGYIHRDIKPDNFVLDKKGEKIYCVDFGLATKYKNKPFKKHLNFCGTVRYASISAHKGYSQSCKDDLEAVCYMLVYLFKGHLPWMYINEKNKKKKYKKIQSIKEKIPENELCSQLPKEYEIFLKYVKNMDYDEEPPYKLFIKMFLKLLHSKKYHNLNLKLI